MVVLEVSAWFILLTANFGLLILLAGRIGKKPVFDRGFHPIALGDARAWFWGWFVIYPVISTIFAWSSKIAGGYASLSDFFLNGEFLYYIPAVLVGLYMIFTYLLDITRFKLIEVSVTVVLCIIFMIIPWSDTMYLAGKKLEGGFIPFVLFLLIIIGFRIVAVILYTIPSTRKAVFHRIKSINEDFAGRYRSVKTTVIIFLAALFFLLLSIFHISIPP